MTRVWTASADELASAVAMLAGMRRGTVLALTGFAPEPPSYSADEALAVALACARQHRPRPGRPPGTTAAQMAVIIAWRAELANPVPDSLDALERSAESWHDYRRTLALAEDVLVVQHGERTAAELARWQESAS